jgi:hypothetical protein
MDLDYIPPFGKRIHLDELSAEDPDKVFSIQMRKTKFEMFSMIPG